MNDLKTFLENFLDKLQYPDDREVFINKLLLGIYLETVNELLNSLPKDKQTSLKQQLNGVTEFETLKKILNDNFEKDVYQNAISKSSQKVICDYLSAIEPLLSEEQFNSLKENFPTQSL